MAHNSDSQSDFFIYVIEVPVDRVYDAVTSPDYLFDIDLDNNDTLEVKETESTTGSENVVTAHVTIGPIDDSAGAGDITQTVDVTPVDQGSFQSLGIIPLPQGLGDVITTYEFSAQGENTEVSSRISLKIPGTDASVAVRTFILEAAQKAVEKDISKIKKLAE